MTTARPATLQTPHASNSGVIGLAGSLIRGLERVPHSLLALAARVFPAAVFWQSGETKVVEGAWWDVTRWFHLGDSTVLLFQNEYALPLLPPEIAAHLAAFAEHFFSVLLVIGLATRLSALALLGMTLVIEIFVFPDAWPTHGVWATCFMLVILRGPGVFSIDHFVAKHFGFK